MFLFFYHRIIHNVSLFIFVLLVAVLSAIFFLTDIQPTIPGDLWLWICAVIPFIFYLATMFFHHAIYGFFRSVYRAFKDENEIDQTAAKKAKSTFFMTRFIYIAITDVFLAVTLSELLNRLLA